MGDEDPEIFSRVAELADQEKQLRSRHQGSPLDEEERLRLEEIETELDQCWDLLKSAEGPARVRNGPRTTAMIIKTAPSVPATAALSNIDVLESAAVSARATGTRIIRRPSLTEGDLIHPPNNSRRKVRSPSAG